MPGMPERQRRRAARLRQLGRKTPRARRVTPLRAPRASDYRLLSARRAGPGSRGPSLLGSESPSRDNDQRTPAHWAGRPATGCGTVQADQGALTRNAAKDRGALPAGRARLPVRARARSRVRAGARAPVRGRWRPGPRRAAPRHRRGSRCGSTAPGPDPASPFPFPAPAPARRGGPRRPPLPPRRVWGSPGPGPERRPPAGASPIRR
jgi:hypothetical protein